MSCWVLFFLNALGQPLTTTLPENLVKKQVEVKIFAPGIIYRKSVFFTSQFKQE
jgi:hypothetical protein